MRFVIVTGMSGAGKSTALHYLEDADYYCVDNLPLQLIKPFAQIANDGTSSEFTKIAVGIDIRSGLSKRELCGVLKSMRESGIKYEILFLDATDNVLLKRYKETRRNHPLAGRSKSLEDAIRKERSQLDYMKSEADYILDTSKLLTRELKRELVRIFVQDKAFKNLMITVQSFGFKYGVPADSDLVIDVRFLPNPYYVENLRPLTGRDQPIIDFVMAQKQTGTFLKKFEELLKFLIPNYISEGKNQLVLSVGCTGGRHRSVVLAEEICKRLSENSDYGLRLEHRDIDRETLRFKAAEGEK
jgi:UPF0042 nucleotide-binding protein